MNNLMQQERDKALRLMKSWVKNNTKRTIQVKIK